MRDLAIAYAAVALASVAVFLLVQSLAWRLSARSCEAAAAAVVTGLIAYIYCLWDQPVLSRWIPTSSLVILGNWLPLFAAAMAALVLRLLADPQRRVLATCGLTVCGVLAAAFPLLGRVPECGDQWDARGTCLQTTRFTCSPACAATLLRKHGIAASEREMARLCLTRQGTTWQGLYRGLKLKTAGTPWDIVVCSGSLTELRAVQGPAILSVGLPGSAPGDSDYSREFGWVPGVNHAVVLEGFDSCGHARIADPSQPMCIEHWDQGELALLWRGYAMRLVPRSEMHD
jgi:hypothetical protein